MSTSRTLRHTVIAGLVLVTFLLQGTWALAGVTGNIAGTVRATNGTPIAGAEIKAVSASQTASATTDASGHFIILSLSPDTYTLNVSKAGYATLALAGTVVFADQTQQVSITLSPQLKTIATVTAQTGGSLVKSGVGGDLYSVNSAQAAAAAPLGGGGNLNSAYSAMSSVPGVQVNVGGQGWTFNAAYVRGQDYYYTGFEYDGIPINRAFDNYNASTESSLGLQELQVYTGGGPSSVATAGTSGFINQVIKSGTFPGFAQANLGIGTPAFYHYAQVEVGGATPDRNFSYYAAFNGTNQAFRLFDSSNGASLMEPGGIYAGAATVGLSPGYTGCVTVTCQGVKPSCQLLTSPLSGFFGGTQPAGCWGYYSGLSATSNFVTDREDVANFHLGIPWKNGLRDDVQLLWSASHLNNGSYGSINDMGPGYQQYFWNNTGNKFAAPTCNTQFNPSGVPGGAPGILTVTGCNPTTGNYVPYADGIAYNVPFGTPIATPTHLTLPSVYFAPGTPAHQFDAPIPLFDEGLNSYQNDTGIVKLQYTHQLSHSAYLRAYGYTFYSDWLQTGPLTGATDGSQPSLPAAEYELITHTTGGAIEFNDQINDQNLLGADLNYTQANVTRFNNTSAYAFCLSSANCSPIGYVTGSGSNLSCYDYHLGKKQPCLSSGYLDVTGPTPIFVNPRAVYTGPSSGGCDTTSNPAPCGWLSNATNGPLGFGGPANATWDSMWSGNATGSFNTVQPRFSNWSVSDQWRPNDRFLLNGSVRYDNFSYNLPQSTSAATQFYANQSANYTCVLAATNQVFTLPLAPGQPPPAPVLYVNGDCNKGVQLISGGVGPQTGWVHPNGKVQDGVAAPNFTAASPNGYTLRYWQPRFSATYTINPETVIRASAGRYTAPPISASVQYLASTGDDRSVWNNTMNLGFYSPFHPIPGISSAQYDLSLEKHLHGTDMSFKVTPFFTWVNNWQQQTFIGSGFVTQVPVGVNRDYGVEFQFNKGDFTRQGFSGQFSFTYTNSKIQFQNVGLSTGGVVPNQTIALNQVIAQYNQLTKAGGGSPCYLNGKGTSCSFTGSKAPSGLILNPYYNMPAQGELDPNGWYNPYVTAIAPNLNGAVDSYIAPITSALILNYRHQKLAVTPSIQFQSGGFYGSPLDNNGYDPRACGLNSANSGVNGGPVSPSNPPITALSPKTNPLQCNVLSLTAPGLGQFGYFYIPNPQTGVFSAIGSYEQPSLITGNLQVTYDVSPRLTVTMTGTNLFHSCFGGSSEPWTQANGPSPNVCGYAPAGGVLNSSVYPSNFYNGTGIGDKAANKVATPYAQSYFPTTGNNGAIGSALPPFNVYFTAQFKI